MNYSKQIRKESNVMKDNKLTMNLEVKGIDEVIKKIEHMVELLKEAKSLADEMTSNELLKCKRKE